MQARATRRTARTGLVLGAAVSVALHGALYAVLQWAGTMPSVDFELQLPNEVAFGVTEPTEAAPVPAPATPAAAPAAPVDDAIAPPKKKPPKKQEPVDAGVADAAPADLDAAAKPLPDAGTPSDGDAGKPLLAAFAPEGAQIALRLHMGRIRDTELAGDVRMLLDAVPDWRLIVDGSGLDPLRDLERLYIATPDLRRSNLVIAGQYVGGQDVPARAVLNLAEKRNVKARWYTKGGVRIAPWANADTTERVLALIAPQQFAITRPDDLPRVLAVARALSARNADGDRSDADAVDALLGLAKDETLALSVEGARLFAQGNVRGIPERLEASVRFDENRDLQAHISGHFESEQAASEARDYWSTLRDRFAGHPLVALIGMRPVLTNAEFSVHDGALQVRTRATLQQARVVLGFISNALRPASAPPPDAAPDRAPADATRPPQPRGR